MIILINGGPPLARFGATNSVARLVSPRSGNRILPGQRWAADNDAFCAWDEGRFVRMLCRVEASPACLFVVAPDVPFNARATLERLDQWWWEIRGRGLPVAFAAQDGAEDLETPWDRLDALFLAGSTAWKLSRAAEDLAREAKARGRWVHMGRVNSRRRMRHAIEIGCDSIDGTGFSRFPDKYLTRALVWLRELETAGRLF